MPIIPAKILREHHVHESGDTRFRACARLLQALWRNSQGLAPGNHTTRRGGKRRLGSLLAEADAQAGRNFMSPSLAHLARHEIAYREPGALIAVQRLLINLLSSQPLAFNLFGPLRLRPDLALPVLRHLLPNADIAKALHVAFEHSPGRMDPALTNDRTAFDVAIAYERRDGKRGLLAFEIKYSEALSESRPGDPADTCSDLAHSSGLYKEPASAALRLPMFEQLFREHLLAQPRRLLLLTLHRYEAHVRSLRRLADCLRVDRIVLVSFHEGLHVCRRDQAHFVTHRLQLARPMMRAAACLQRHHASWLCGEEVEQLAATQLPAEHHRAALISATGMKNVLGDIQTDCGNFRHGRLPQVVFQHLHFGTSMPSGGVHPISFRR
ncbi:hypothetical protein FHS95_002762 [Sphingomonas naasensis]|nr:hypothetical protein [Sphingomonas naasensis]